MKQQPISFSDQQLAMIQAGAGLLPSEHARGNYMRCIANRLGDLPQVTDATVLAVVVGTLSDLGVSGGARFLKLVKGGQKWQITGHATTTTTS